jgi:protein subunit release factor B
MPNDDVVVPRKHYDPLIGAATLLLTVSNNLAATVLEGGPYESMLRNPCEALKAALANVPGGASWDGVWRDTDVEYETYRHDAQPRNMPDIGVKATHIPTGTSAESYVKHSVEANKDAARKGLKAIVERRAKEMRP